MFVMVGVPDMAEIKVMDACLLEHSCWVFESCLGVMREGLGMSHKKRCRRVKTLGVLVMDSLKNFSMKRRGGWWYLMKVLGVVVAGLLKRFRE